MESIYTHGTALLPENPEQLLGFAKFGWGAQITFVKPTVDHSLGFAVVDEQGPGSWFHLPLTSMPNPVGISLPFLTGIMLLFGTSQCRISAIHVYDGPGLVEKFEFPTNESSMGLKGSLVSPFRQALTKPHRIRYAAGLSFFASSFADDFNVGGALGEIERADPGVLILSTGGADYDLELNISESGRAVGQVFHEKP